MVADVVLETKAPPIKDGDFSADENAVVGLVILGALSLQGQSKSHRETLPSFLFADDGETSDDKRV